MRLCDWSALEPQLSDLTSRIEQGKPARPPFVVVTRTDSPALQRRAAEIWVRETCPPQSQLPPIPRRARHTKLRVGYYSADYYNHAIAQLAAGLFERHEREKFEIVAFNFGRGQNDSMTERLRVAFDRLVDVRGKTMAAPFMDYPVADATLIPPEARAHYTEKVVYLPGSYQVNDR